MKIKNIKRIFKRKFYYIEKKLKKKKMEENQNSNFEENMIENIEENIQVEESGENDNIQNEQEEQVIEENLPTNEDQEGEQQSTNLKQKVEENKGNRMSYDDEDLMDSNPSFNDERSSNQIQNFQIEERNQDQGYLITKVHFEGFRYEFFFFFFLIFFFFFSTQKENVLMNMENLSLLTQVK